MVNGWKEIKNSVVDVLWQKGHKEVWVYKTRDRSKNIKWAVTLRATGFGTTPDRLFQTKLKALVFAKAYMRKH